MVNSDTPLVTCCIPCYNHEQYIESAIRSVIKQTYINIELIVINDGSSDNCSSIINCLEKECVDRFVNYIFIDRENKGLSSSLNEMISISNGYYVTLLASDDEFLPNKIETLVSEFESLNSSYGAVFGDAIVNCDGNISDSGKFFLEKYGFSFNGEATDVHYSDILKRNFLPAMSGIYRKDVLTNIGMFSVNLRLEDWDIYLRLLQSYKIRLVKEVVAKYRLHGNNSIYKQNYLLLLDTVEILKKQRSYSFKNNMQSIWYGKLYDTYIGLIRLKKYNAILIKDATFLSFIIYLIKKIKKKII